MEAALYAAIHANRLLAARRVGSISAASACERVGPWLCVDTGAPGFWQANSATPVEAVTATDVESAIAWFEARGAAFSFIVRSKGDEALQRELALRGWERGPSERMMTLAAPRSPAYDGPLQMREAVSDADIEAYGKVGGLGDGIGVAIARTARSLGFGLVLGELDGLPVATGMVAVTGHIAGIYNVGVLETYRRRGFGTAITWEAIEAGLRRGADTVWLGSSEAGYSIYRRMGFSDCFDYLHVQAPS